jgi:hypothetical protein
VQSMLGQAADTLLDHGCYIVMTAT